MKHNRPIFTSTRETLDHCNLGSGTLVLYNTYESNSPLFALLMMGLRRLFTGVLDIDFMSPDFRQFSMMSSGSNVSHLQLSWSHWRETDVSKWWFTWCIFYTTYFKIKWIVFQGWFILYINNKDTRYPTQTWISDFDKHKEGQTDLAHCLIVSKICCDHFRPDSA